ncbi:hypothetical protein GJ496_005754 [Pomphorhynchus laevis]|nr:hypothetical protein GJ496_005754 [Pomphorhynchus laevis]
MSRKIEQALCAFTQCKKDFLQNILINIQYKNKREKIDNSYVTDNLILLLHDSDPYIVVKTLYIIDRCWSDFPVDFVNLLQNEKFLDILDSVSISCKPSASRIILSIIGKFSSVNELDTYRITKIINKGLRSTNSLAGQQAALTFAKLATTSIEFFEKSNEQNTFDALMSMLKSTTAASSQISALKAIKVYSNSTDIENKQNRDEMIVKQLIHMINKENLDLSVQGESLDTLAVFVKRNKSLGALLLQQGFLPNAFSAFSKNKSLQHESGMLSILQSIMEDENVSNAVLQLGTGIILQRFAETKINEHGSICNNLINNLIQKDIKSIYFFDINKLIITLMKTLYEDGNSDKLLISTLNLIATLANRNILPLNICSSCKLLNRLNSISDSTMSDSNPLKIATIQCLQSIRCRQTNKYAWIELTIDSSKCS